MEEQGLGGLLLAPESPDFRHNPSFLFNNDLSWFSSLESSSSSTSLAGARSLTSPPFSLPSFPCRAAPVWWLPIPSVYLKTPDLATLVWPWDANSVKLQTCIYPIVYSAAISMCAGHPEPNLHHRGIADIHPTCSFNSLHPSNWWQLLLSSCSGQKSVFVSFFTPNPNPIQLWILVSLSSNISWTEQLSAASLL